MCAGPFKAPKPPPPPPPPPPPVEAPDERTPDAIAREKARRAVGRRALSTTGPQGVPREESEFGYGPQTLF